jgi:hypothetical protein
MKDSFPTFSLILFFMAGAAFGQGERLQAIKKVYLSVGEEETWEMLKGFDVLRHAFRDQGFDRARLKAQIIPESAHVGAMPTALYNGLRFLFPNSQ